MHSICLFSLRPFLLNQSGWRVCRWGTDCSNIRGQRHRRREPIEQTCIGQSPHPTPIDPPLMVAEVQTRFTCTHTAPGMECHTLCQGGVNGGGGICFLGRQSRLYIWSLLAKRESITFLALLALSLFRCPFLSFSTVFL